MTKILRIDSSPRGERSHSRALTEAFTDALQKQHPDSEVTYRDLGHNPPAHVNEQWIAGTYSDPATHTPEMTAALIESEEMIAELFAADTIVIGAPMYNFSIPSTLKAYIDQIVRPGRTFKHPEYEGLVTGKKMYILCARRRRLRAGRGYGAGQLSRPLLQADFRLDRHHRHRVRLRRENAVGRERFGRVN